MLQPLKDMVEMELGYQITHALASFPYLTALYPEDIWDAFEYVGLIFQKYIPWDVAVPDYAANYASQGYFLCKDYKNKTQCLEEQQDLNVPETGEFSTFNFHLSDTALMLNVPIMRSPYDYNMYLDRRFENFDLGMRARSLRGEEGYWTAVAAMIEQSSEVSKLQWDTCIMYKVFVTGEGAKEERFRDMVRMICEPKGLDVEFFTHIPLYLQLRNHLLIEGASASSAS
ncbi:hypothetical protein EJ08DRAFT_232108 [Tothia fuscella]|uniref:Uncharacterized protein n=1 Tax=Tothia fuscella TaxID=1048955 RepID=A0A9P4P117_9PEZI|nr:hypothetical protein EJ08DRAFT_232108 [Tothia fuscella]